MLLDPGRCEELPGWLLCVLLPGEAPGVRGVLKEPELLDLIPDCEPLMPGEPTLLPALCRCCIAIVRVSDSTICSRRATRASNEPEPLIELPKLPVPELSVPLLELEPSVSDPVAVEDCPKPPLAVEEDVPLWPLTEPDALAPWREDDEPSPDWPGCPACDEEEPVDPMRELLEPLAPGAPGCGDVPVELPGVDCEYVVTERANTAIKTPSLFIYLLFYGERNRNLHETRQSKIRRG